MFKFLLQKYVFKIGFYVFLESFIKTNWAFFFIPVLAKSLKLEKMSKKMQKSLNGMQCNGSVQTNALGWNRTTVFWIETQTRYPLRHGDCCINIMGSNITLKYTHTYIPF